MKPINRRHARFSLFPAIAAALAVPLAAEDVILPVDDIEWSMTGNPAMQVMVLTGDPCGDGPYSMLIKVAPATEIPHYSHPDEWRHSVVLSGSVRFGQGETCDDEALVALAPGSFSTQAPGSPRFIRVGEDRAIALLTANGPTGMTPVSTD